MVRAEFDISKFDLEDLNSAEIMLISECEKSKNGVLKESHKIEIKTSNKSVNFDN